MLNEGIIVVVTKRRRQLDRVLLLIGRAQRTAAQRHALRTRHARGGRTSPREEKANYKFRVATPDRWKSKESIAIFI